MPISQDRLITLTNHAAALIDTIDTLHKTVRNMRIGELTLHVNSALARIEDAQTRAIVSNLRETLLALQNHIGEIYIESDLRQNVAMERAHFAKYAKSNRALAERARYRRAQSALDLTPTTAPNASAPTRPSVSYNGRIFWGTWEEVQNDPEFIAYKGACEQTTKRVYNGQTPAPVKLSKIDEDYLAGRISREQWINAQMELRASTAPANPVPLKTEPNAPVPLEASTSRQANDPSRKDVLRTSVPSDAELYGRVPIAPGQDAL